MTEKMAFPLLSSRFEESLEQTTYQIDARPTYLVVSGITLAIVLLIVLAFVSRRSPGALVSPFVPLVIVPVAAGLSYGVRLLSRESNHRSAAFVFRTAIAVDETAVATGAGVVLAALLIFLLRQGGHRTLLPIIVPCIFVAGSLSYARTHERAIREIGELPLFAIDGPKEMHVGRDRDVSVKLGKAARSWSVLFMSGSCDPCELDETMRREWSPTQDTVHVHASAAGAVGFSARARRGPVTLETKLHVVARRELASPFLSLRVGDSFTYRVRARSSDGALFYFITMKGDERIDALTIDVAGTRERDGFRTFILTIRRGEEDREVEVVAIDGTTRVYDVERRLPGDEILTLLGAPSATDPTPCRFALLSANAVCQRGGREADVPAKPEPEAPRKRGAPKTARPPIAFAAAAPASFEQSSSSTANALAAALVALTSGGLLIPPNGSSSSSFTLVATRRGPEGAPEAPPANW